MTTSDPIEQAIFAARLEERITSLRELIDEREKQGEQQLGAIRATMQKAEERQNELNSKANEFRDALDDAAKLAANTQATKLELQAVKDTVVTHATQNELDRVLDRVTTLERKSEGTAGRATGVGAAQDFLFRTLPILVAVAALAFAIFNRGAIETIAK